MTAAPRTRPHGPERPNAATQPATRPPRAARTDRNLTVTRHHALHRLTDESRLGAHQRPRGRDRDALTPTERQIAELVATGKTNRDVAAELFVTVRTVESNLTRIYSKPGVRSRRSWPRDAVKGSDAECASGFGTCA